ncbi:MAG: hypothetical protein ACRETA_10510 [Gammaproteobacteria bacterium]
MKTLTRNYFSCLLGLVLAAVFATAAAASSPFVGSRSEPHAVLYMNVNQSAKQIWPVKIWAVDGQLTNRSDSGVLWIKPGKYTFDMKLGKVNLADVPGLQTSASFGQEKHDLKIKVEAGKAYYIGAKFEASGKWQPVVWKTEDSKY